MNKQRRKALQNISERLDEIRSDLSDVVTEEQDAFDNLPEGLQYSEKGEAIEENAQELETAVDDVSIAFDAVQGVLER